MCLDVHDVVLSKYVAGREKDLAFNRALVRHACVAKWTLLKLAKTLPVDALLKDLVLKRIRADFQTASS